jgi:hypothetical protein
LNDLKKKYVIAAVIAGAIIVGVLAFTYNNTSQTNSSVISQQPNTTNSSVTSQQPNTTNSSGTVTPPTTTGRHFFAGIHENVTVTSNP